MQRNGLNASVGRLAVIVAGVLLTLPSCLARTLAAQTLAHRGWAGSGITVDPWWKNAVFLELDPARFREADAVGTGGLKGVADLLDSFAALGPDALVLGPMTWKPGEGGFDPALGTNDDFDHLEQEAASRRIRLIIELPLVPTRSTEETLAIGRFWLGQGVGGLRLTSPNDAGALPELDKQERVHALSRLCAGFSGDRVLLVDAPAPGLSTIEAVPRIAGRGSRQHGGSLRAASQATTGQAQLTIDHRLLDIAAWDPERLRVLVAGGVANAVLPSDAPGNRSHARFGDVNDPAVALAFQKMVATLLFAGREAPMLYFGQESGQLTGQQGEGHGGDAPQQSAAPAAGEGSLLSWYRELSALRHSNGTLRAGSVALVDTGYPDVVAWVRRATNRNEQPVMVVLSLSSRPLVLSLQEPLRRVGLSATSGVRPLATASSSTSPAASADLSYTASQVKLPAYGIYLGELRQPGLEAAAAPAVRSRSRSRSKGK